MYFNRRKEIEILAPSKTGETDLGPEGSSVLKQLWKKFIKERMSEEEANVDHEKIAI